MADQPWVQQGSQNCDLPLFPPPHPHPHPGAFGSEEKTWRRDCQYPGPWEVLSMGAGGRELFLPSSHHFLFKYLASGFPDLATPVPGYSR